MEPPDSVEFLTGFIKDLVCNRIPNPWRELCIRAIDDGIKEAEKSGWQSDGGKEAMEAVCELCHYLKDTPNTRIFCYSILMIFGRMEMSETELAKQVGVTKACVSKIKTTVQDHYGIPTVFGRSNAARALFSSRRIDSVLGPPKPVKQWPGKKLVRQGFKLSPTLLHS